jgi:broad specificity phosphatase PhoE
MSEPRWPEAITLVRHAESAGNVARDLAEASGAPFIDIAERDMDVPLSRRGEDQAAALGRWIADAAEPPAAILSSPYLRAHETARLLRETSGLEPPIVLDERLREREFGVLDRLTRVGIEQRYPEQAEARRRLGKFYHRPPGGESWCDVALRVRSALDSISREHAGDRVLIVAHEVVVLMFRYVIERLTEADVLALGRSANLANCSVSSFVRRPDGSGMRLERFGEIAPLLKEEAPVTREPDRAVAPR